MDESDKFIRHAESIKVSGRWRAHNLRVKELSKKFQNEQKIWEIFVFSELTYNVFDEFNKLKKTYKSKDISAICWRSRNLLELSIWVIFCTLSEEHVRQFRGDAGRDAHDLFNALMKWEKGKSEALGWADKINKAKDVWEGHAENNELGLIETSYTKVQRAAKECGMKGEFDITNKILSKFTHPTALKIGGTLKEDKIDELQKAIFAIGCNCFVGAFVNLESYLLKIK